jgi:hypothetical protein
MQVRKAVLRAAGAAMVIFAVAPWIGAGSASASVTVFVADKWSGTDSATTTAVPTAGCEYAEITTTHTGQGWHFVLPGGGGLTSFSANFATAGTITVTTTETAAGVIVQGGKGAVVYTPTDDVLTSTAAFADHPGTGTAASAGSNDMQLSHLCGEGVTPPIDECTNIDGNQSEVPAGYHQNEDGTCSPDESGPPPSSTPPTDLCTNIDGNQATVPSGYIRNADGTCSLVSNSVSTTASVAATTASQQVSVLPTKKHTSTPTTSVLGTKAGSELPHTGNSLPVTALVVLSLGLLAGGGALVAAPAVARSKKPRRH